MRRVNADTMHVLMLCMCLKQNLKGDTQLALRFAWLAGEIVDLDLLTCPNAEPLYPRQVYWQKDACADGACHIKGES